MFDRISQELKSFLAPLSISTTHSDVFEETLLKLAGVETQPACCQFADSPSQWRTSPSETRMYFRIWGITSDDAEKFLNFFKVTHGDTSATMSYSPLPKAFNPEDGEDAMVLFLVEDLRNFDSHVFDVDGATVLNQILPLVKDEINRLHKEAPEALAGYQEKSKAEFEKPELIKRYYLPKEAVPVAAEPAKPSMLRGIYNFFQSYLAVEKDQNISENEADKSDRFII